jgi:DNA-binding response OmpR family regulator
MNRLTVWPESCFPEFIPTNPANAWRPAMEQPSEAIALAFSEAMQLRGVIFVRKTRVLLVEDGGRSSGVRELLENKTFDVISTTNFSHALSQILTESLDALIVNLHHPDPRACLALITAMQHSQPEALNVVLNVFVDAPEKPTGGLPEGSVLVGPSEIGRLPELISKKTRRRKRSLGPTRKSVATILESDVKITIRRWLSRVRTKMELSEIILDDADRTRYLSGFMEDIVTRLRDDREIEGNKRISKAAAAHGRLRYRQNYTAPMIVEESRILQVCIFETIQRNLGSVDFSLVLPDIMLIADEVDSQLTQTIRSFLKADASAVA